MTVEALRKMADMGLSLQQAIEIIEAMGTRERSKGAARQARYRERLKGEGRDVTSDVTRDDNGDGNSDASPTLPLAPETKTSPGPPKKTQPSNPNPHPPIVPPLPEKPFDKFWSAYPAKKAKRQAEAAFDRALKRGSLTAMLAGIEAAKASREWREGFIPHPATWLNGDRWLDEAEADVAEPTLALTPPWPGPPEIRAAIVAAKGEAFARSWLDPCGWINGPVREIRTKTGVAADRINQEVGHVLAELKTRAVHEAKGGGPPG